MIFSPEQLANAESLGISLAANLIFKVMENALSGKEPEFKGLLDLSINESAKIFCEEFKDVQIYSEGFDGLLKDIVSSYVGPKESTAEVNLASLIQSELEKRKLIFNANESTMKSYCEFYSKVFCYVFHDKILSSNYKSILEAEHLISSKENSIRQNKKLDRLLSNSDTQSERLENIENKIETLIGINNTSSVNSMIFIDDNELDDIEDKQIANKIKLIEDLKEKKDFKNGISEAKKLLLEIPKSNLHLYSKVFHLLLGIHLQGDEAEYKDGVSLFSKSDIKTPYSKVICSGLLNNSKSWADGYKLITSIRESDLLSFSKSQKDVYFQVRVLLEYNLNLQDEALESLSSINEKDGDEYKYLSLLLYSKKDDISKLDIALQLLNDKKDLRFLSGAINYILDQFNLLHKKVKNPFLATHELKEYFETISRKVPEVLDVVEESGALYESCITGLICTFHLQGKFEDARKYINSGKRLGISEYAFLYNSSLCMFLVGDYHEVYELLSKMEFKDLLKTNAFDMFVHATSKVKKDFDYNEYIVKLKALKLSSLKTDKLLNVIFQYTLSPEDFLLVAKENYEKYPDFDWSCFDYAGALLKCKKVSEVEEPLLKAREVTDVEIVANAKLAKYYATNIKNYKKALQCYEKIISQSSPVQEVVEYLHCLNLESEFPKILNFVDEFDPYEQQPKIQLYKAYALWQLGQIEIAWSVIKPIVKYFQEDPVVMQNYASLSFEKGNLSEVVWGLRKQVVCEPNVGATRMRLSQALMATADFEGAVKEAKKAVDTNFDNDLIHFNFINIHLSASKQLPKNPVINSKEYNDLHSDLLANFNTRFPNSKLLQPQVLKYDNNNQLDLSEIKEQLKQMEERNLQVLSYYWDQKFPLTFVMQTLNRNAQEVWSNIISSGYRKGLFVGSSNVNLLNEEIKNITMNDGKFIIDPIGLFSFKSAGMLHILSELEDLCVGAETIKHLSQIHHRLMSMGDGYLTLGVHEGQMVKEEIGREQLNSAKAYIKEIIDFCNDKLQVVSTPNDFKLGIDKRLLDVFDPVYREIVYFSEKSFKCISGDWNLISFLRNYGHKNCSIQSLIIYLNNLKRLKTKDYYSLICEWLLYNYRGLVYSSVDIGNYLRTSQNESRSLFLLDRVFNGYDFGTDTNKITFCAELFSDFSNVFKTHNKYLEKMKEYLISNKVSEKNKMFFVITVFSRCIENEKTRPVVEEIFPLLEIRDSEQNLVTVKYAKELLRQVHKKGLELEQKEYEKKLGLGDTVEE